jgi:hypothetical protein
MTATVPTTEPTSARAGDTWKWRREDLADYPAPTWVLTYYFRNATAKFAIAAAADGVNHAVSVAMATTSAYTVGDYDWVALAESASERVQVDAGRLRVLHNFETDAVYDARSFARTMLDAVEAALTSKATASQLDIVKAALADRSMEYNPATLMALRSRLLTEVRREAAAQKGTDVRRVLVRFG